jgi:hypothetical protein
MEHSASNQPQHHEHHTKRSKSSPRLGRAELLVYPVLKLFVGKINGRLHSISLYQEIESLVGGGKSAESRQKGMSKRFLVFQL